MQLDYSTPAAAEKSAAALAARFQLVTSPHHLDNVRQAVHALQVACQALYIVRKHQECTDRESRACDVATAVSDACEQLRETLYDSLPFSTNPPPWALNPPTVKIEPYFPTSYAPACGASEF